MKQKIIMFICTILFFSNTTYARNYIIALSPMQSSEALEQQATAVMRFLVKNVNPGETALLVDGLHLKTITEFSVKNNQVYDNPKAKIQLNRQAIAALRHFSTHPVALAQHGISGVMQVPQLLEFLGRNYGSFEDTEIILIASPVYVDARNPDWGMVNNQYPGDGHFNAAPQASPFSLRGREKLLTNTRIHWAYPDDNWIS